MLLHSNQGGNGSNIAATAFFEHARNASCLIARLSASVQHTQHIFKKLTIFKNVLQVLQVLRSRQFTASHVGGYATFRAEVLHFSMT